MSETFERDRADYDIVIVGGGVAGLSAAIRIKQKRPDVSIILFEKGAEIGSHILSGAVINPSALHELFPDENDLKDAPLTNPVTTEKFYYLGCAGVATIPQIIMPPFMHNDGNYIISLGVLTKFLSQKAEALGVEVYASMSVSDILYSEKDEVIGVVAGVYGLDKEGRPSSEYQAGMDVYGKYTLFAEGARGSLSQKLIAKYDLSKGKSPQKYGLGFKEIWQIDKKYHNKGHVVHTLGYPLTGKTGGGGFIYHYDEDKISIGMVVHLDYKNPYLSPYEEFQAFKHHPLVCEMLSSGKRLSYGARVINEGGIQSIPKLYFKGGALIGCSAGFVNLPQIKGSHNAMHSAIMAADSICEVFDTHQELSNYQDAMESSQVYKELEIVQNVKPLWSKLGLLGGLVLGGMDMWLRYLSGNFLKLCPTLGHEKSDADSLELAQKHQKISYPKPDNLVSFDRLTSVSLTGTYHEEHQLCHLRLRDKDLPISHNLKYYDEPAQRYCPAGVYEILEDEHKQPYLQINSQNCIHCKTCDLKDPAKNITWFTPNGGNGPRYGGM